jgi:hypothetical protein
VISEGKTVKTAKPGKLADPVTVAKAAKLAGTALGAAAIKTVDAVQKHGNGDEDDQVRPHYSVNLGAQVAFALQ